MPLKAKLSKAEFEALGETVPKASAFRLVGEEYHLDVTPFGGLALLSESLRDEKGRAERLETEQTALKERATKLEADLAAEKARKAGKSEDEVRALLADNAKSVSAALQAEKEKLEAEHRLTQSLLINSTRDQAIAAACSGSIGEGDRAEAIGGNPRLLGPHIAPFLRVELPTAEVLAANPLAKPTIKVLSATGDQRFGVDGQPMTVIGLLAELKKTDADLAGAFSVAGRPGVPFDGQGGSGRPSLGDIFGSAGTKVTVADVNLTALARAYSADPGGTRAAAKAAGMENLLPSV